MWYVHPCCAITNEGIADGMEWLVANVTARRKEKKPS